MANIKSAIKRMKTNETRRARNTSMKSAMRTAIKKFEAYVVNKDVEQAKEAFKVAAKKLIKLLPKESFIKMQPLVSNHA